MSSQNPGAKSPFDPLARHVDQETGLEYEDIAAKICGRPLESGRNDRIVGFRTNRYPETAIKAYWKAFDACPEVFDGGSRRYSASSAAVSVYYRAPHGSERHEAGVKAGKATGCWGPAGYNDPAKYISDQLDVITYAVLSAGLKIVAKPSDVVKVNCAT